MEHKLELKEVARVKMQHGHCCRCFCCMKRFVKIPYLSIATNHSMIHPAVATVGAPHNTVAAAIAAAAAVCCFDASFFTNDEEPSQEYTN